MSNCDCWTVTESYRDIQTQPLLSKPRIQTFISEDCALQSVQIYYDLEGFIQPVVELAFSAVFKKCGTICSTHTDEKV